MTDPFGQPDRATVVCDECLPLVDAVEAFIENQPSAAEQTGIAEDEERTAQLEVRGRSVGLDKLDLDATETRAFLEFVERADGNKKGPTRKIRMLPSSDEGESYGRK